MRRGIGLRGYAQQDPLNEFRARGLRLYEELRGLIRHGVASSIFRVTVTRQPAPGTAPAVAASLARGAAAVTGRHGANGRARPAGAPGAAAAARGPAAGAARRFGHPARRTAGPADRVRCANRSATSRSPASGGGAGRRAGPEARASPRAARGSGATTRAGADPGRKYKKCHGR